MRPSRRARVRTAPLGSTMHEGPVLPATTTDTAAEVVLLPAASVATARTRCVPSAADAEDQRHV